MPEIVRSSMDAKNGLQGS